MSQIIRPEHAGVANAIGVAIAQVSGTIDRVFSLEKMSRTEAIDEATVFARERAKTAGADPDTVDILDLEDKTQTKVTQLSGAVFQGFSDNILEEAQRPREIEESNG